MMGGGGFGGGMEAWDLQAVVGARCCGGSAVVCEEDCLYPLSYFDSLNFPTSAAGDYGLSSSSPPPQSALFGGGFPGNSHDLYVFDEMGTAPVGFLDELEEVYKPFYPDEMAETATNVTSSSLSAVSGEEVVQEQQQEKKPQLLSQDHVNVNPPAVDAATGLAVVHAAIRTKKRKNQQKKVVQQVTSEGLSSDPWAWRKYGQKPIKGSPYPRSYYRCSSLKGCLARKQVERSRSDPDTFIVTYTAEHNHAHPVRRSTLAGRNRKRSFNPNTPASGADSACSPNSSAAAVVSPSILAASVDGRSKTQEIMGREKEDRTFEEISEEINEEEEEDDVLISDMMMSSTENDGFLMDIELNGVGGLTSSYLAFDKFLLDGFPETFSQ
ncbi:WRKY transcription factor 22-like [Malania oleifera]|uniref:WRKY transcription factor 22-like n=1 Tax=Malania oleifera TaxID=397392 RepID=UPI0025AE0430|nr:WRKY transcription factor 22-like [Malania oleifera]